jgi:hypothetical protein
MHKKNESKSVTGSSPEIIAREKLAAVSSPNIKND